jgi:hypothetical protein
MHFPPPFGWSKILIFYDFSLSGLQTIRPLLRPGFIKVNFLFHLFEIPFFLHSLSFTFISYYIFIIIFFRGGLKKRGYTIYFIMFKIKL